MVQHAIRLAEGFRPGGLSEAAPAVAGVRPWWWLVDEQTSEEERSAYLARFVRGVGTVDPTDRDLALAPRPAAEVVAGHLAQQVVVDLPGVPALALRVSGPGGPAGPPADAGPGAGPVGSSAHQGRDSADDGPTVADGTAGVAFPFRGPVAIVGSTVPSVHAARVAGRHLGEELGDFLAGRGIESWPGMAADPGREWVDQVLVVAAGDLAEVVLAAGVAWQPYLTLWRADPRHAAGVLEVLSTADLGGAVLAAGPARVERVEVRPCPMVPGAGCGDLCTMHGGPWVSRSITAAMRWEARRARMIRALGCDTCGDGAVTALAGKVHPGRRQAVPLRPDVSTPTRHDRLVDADALPPG